MINTFNWVNGYKGTQTLLAVAVSSLSSDDFISLQRLPRASDVSVLCSGGPKILPFLLDTPHKVTV